MNLDFGSFAPFALAGLTYFLQRLRGGAAGARPLTIQMLGAITATALAFIITRPGMAENWKVTIGGKGPTVELEVAGYLPALFWILYTSLQRGFVSVIALFPRPETLQFDQFLNTSGLRDVIGEQCEQEKQLTTEMHFIEEMLPKVFYTNYEVIRPQGVHITTTFLYHESGIVKLQRVRGKFSRRPASLFLAAAPSTPDGEVKSFCLDVSSGGGNDKVEAFAHGQWRPNVVPVVDCTLVAIYTNDVTASDYIYVDTKKYLSPDRGAFCKTRLAILSNRVFYEHQNWEMSFSGDANNDPVVPLVFEVSSNSKEENYERRMMVEDFGHVLEAIARIASGKIQAKSGDGKFEGALYAIKEGHKDRVESVCKTALQILCIDCKSQSSTDIMAKIWDVFKHQKCYENDHLQRVLLHTMRTANRG